MEDALWLGYVAGLIFGGVVAFISYLGIKGDLLAEKRLYTMMQKDLDQLIDQIVEERRA